MEANRKKSPLGMVAAVPFAVIALRQLVMVVRNLTAGGISPSLWMLLYLVVELAVVVCLLLRQKTVVLPVMAIVWGVLEVRALFANLTNLLDYFSFSSLLVLVSDLLGILTMILFGAILFANLEEKARNVWFLPGVIALLHLGSSALPGLGNILSMLRYGETAILSIMLWSYIFYPLLLAVGVWLASAWFAYPDGMSQKPAYPYM